MKSLIDILLIDDNEEFREIMGYLFRQKGWSLVSCGSGQEAFACMEEIQPKVILLDLQLPGMPGRDFLERIQEQESLQRVPIVILSAASSPKIPVPSVLVKKCLSKSCGAQVILDTVSSFVDNTQFFEGNG